MFNQRCNIFGNLQFDKLEEEIIRHPEFNRLADIKQLGYSYKGAYKGATHSRLSHSLGTCHLARQILLTTVEKNFQILKDKPKAIGFPTIKDLNDILKEKNVLSVAALLHDINHLPFAHCIQDHLDLFSDLIQSETGFQKRIDNFGDCDLFDFNIRDKVKKVLVKEWHGKYSFAKLFHDIIRGDFGASTLDFVSRDYLKCGFGKLDDDRPDNNFILIKDKNGIRLALDLRVNNFSLSKLYSLLYNRYRLSQRVYFHHTNTVAEAMIGRALRRLLELGHESGKNLLNEFLEGNDNDFRFMCSLEDHPDALISKIGIQLRTRQLYDKAFILECPIATNLQEYLVENFRGITKYENCKLLENKIARELNLGEGDIIIFCYNSKMYEFEVNELLTINKDHFTCEIGGLSVESYVEKDSIRLLKTLHNKLWRFYVFCKRVNNVAEHQTMIEKVSDFCSNIFRNRSTIKDFMSDNLHNINLATSDSTLQNKQKIQQITDDKSFQLKKKTVIKIFIASSEELSNDRDQIEIFLSRENDYLFEKDVRFQLVRWENFLDTISKTRLQDEYNKVLRTCDIVVCLYYTKVGKYTAEEFDEALGHFRGTGKPLILTYFKDAPAKPSELRAYNTVLEFKEKLSELGHFPNHYESIGDLKHHFGEQLKKLGIS